MYTEKSNLNRNPRGLNFLFEIIVELIVPKQLIAFLKKYISSYLASEGICGYEILPLDSSVEWSKPAQWILLNLAFRPLFNIRLAQWPGPLGQSAARLFEASCLQT